LVLRPELPAALTIATYGYNFELARAAAVRLLMDYEVFSELVVFSQLSPFDGSATITTSGSAGLNTGLSAVLESLQTTRRLLTVEEAALSLGWGAEIAVRVAERSNDQNHYYIRRAAALDLPIANSKPLEDAILPSVDAIVKTALELCRSGR
jgi:pyruvate/2-oxoglutarate/acetoin dehydrogenase E1 component